MDYKTYKNGRVSEFAEISSKLLLQIASDWKVKPIADNSFRYSIYDEFYDKRVEKSELEKYAPYSNSGFFLNYKLLSLNNLSVYFILVMIMLLYEGYISEKKSGQQIYMIQSQPISKLKYHHIKILASVFVTALCLLMMFIFIFMIGYLIDGVEGFNFPVMIYKNRLENFMTVSENMVEKSICFISMWRFLLRNFVTSLIISYYISSLFSLISIFVKKKSQLLSIGFGIIVVGYFLTNLINNEIIKTILPFLYLNPYKISNLSYKIVYNSMDIGYLQSITVMILWGLIMSIVGGILSEKVKQKA